MTSQEKLQKPVTYGDVFPAVAEESGPLASEPVTMEDASLMQTAESLAFGGTQKGGAASAMQSAAAKNVDGGLVGKDAHSLVAESGVTVSETAIPGVVVDVSYIGDQPIAGSARPTPTDPALASLDAVTIGEALEAAAVGAGDRPIDESDARAIMSAEARATGVAMPAKGGLGAMAQAAANLNARDANIETATLSDILMDATADLPADKVVTHEDAFKVLQAEMRGKDMDDIREGGIGATLAAAANINELQGLIPPASGDLDFEGEGAVEEEVGKYLPLNTLAHVNSTGGEEEGEGAVEEEVGKYVPLNTLAHVNSTGGEEELTPLVTHGSAASADGASEHTGI